MSTKLAGRNDIITSGCGSIRATSVSAFVDRGTDVLRVRTDGEYRSVICPELVDASDPATVFHEAPKNRVLVVGATSHHVVQGGPPCERTPRNSDHDRHFFADASPPEIRRSTAVRRRINRDDGTDV